MKFSRKLQLAAGALLALLPSVLKIPCYRALLGYRIGRGVRIGFSLFAGVGRCSIGDGVRIGHWNAFVGVAELSIGAHARIGFMNLFRGGAKLSLGPYCTVLRHNVMNSIEQPDAVNPTTPELTLGAGAVVTTGHWLDFTDKLELGAHSIVGGRNSSLWTHNRARTRPLRIGHHCYLGSEVRVAPGAHVPDLSVVALGSVLLRRVETAGCLIAGNPATAVRPLASRDLLLVTRKTRRDIPDEVAAAWLPPDIAAAMAGGD